MLLDAGLGSPQEDNAGAMGCSPHGTIEAILGEADSMVGAPGGNRHLDWIVQAAQRTCPGLAKRPFLSWKNSAR